jgi:hypothetical protein
MWAREAKVLGELLDRELSELFAVEVAETLKKETPCQGGVRAFSVRRTGAWREIHEDGYWPDDFVPFATSVDAVIPFLTRMGWAEVNQWSMRDGVPAEPRWRVRFLVRGGYIEGEADTFARAACIALILAKRAEKEKVAKKDT